MARNHARILSSVWDDDDFLALSEAAQRAYFVVISQPELTACGVLTFNPKRLGRLANDSTAARVNKAVRFLVAAGYLILDDDTDEMWVRTFMKHDRINESPNMLKAAARSWRSIHSRSIRQHVYDQLPEVVKPMWPDAVLAVSPKALGEVLAEGQREPEGEPDEEGLPEGFPEGFAEPNAEPLPEGAVDHSLSPKPEAENPNRRRLPPKGSPNPVGSASAETDDDDPLTVIDAAVTAIAEAKLQLVERERGARGDPIAWLASAWIREGDRYRADLESAARQHPTADGPALARIVVPALLGGDPTKRLFTRPRCQLCKGNGHVLDDEDYAATCPDCGGTGQTAVAS